MTDQDRMARLSAWDVRKACLDHAMSVQTISSDADQVVAFATKLEAYVMRDVALGKVTEVAEG